ncbi:MAG: hypothetical protein ACJAW3_001405 [Lentimonas sp.]|jgi:hypothetical protein
MTLFKNEWVNLFTTPKATHHDAPHRENIPPWSVRSYQ